MRHQLPVTGSNRRIGRQNGPRVARVHTPFRQVQPELPFKKRETQKVFKINRNRHRQLPATNGNGS